MTGSTLTHILSICVSDYPGCLSILTGYVKKKLCQLHSSNREIREILFRERLRLKEIFNPER